MREERFVYGLVVNFKDFFETNHGFSIADVLNLENDEVQGIFTGRDGEFIILGKVIQKPELTNKEKSEIRKKVKSKFGFDGNFYYYCIVNEYYKVK